MLVRAVCLCLWYSQSCFDVYDLTCCCVQNLIETHLNSGTLGDPLRNTFGSIDPTRIRHVQYEVQEVGR
jgi:hypothetical protein